MVDLLIRHPPTYKHERKYIYDVMFNEFLGLDYHAIIGDRLDITQISLPSDSSRKCLIINEGLFAKATDGWLTRESLPKQPLNKWVLPDVFRSMSGVSSYIPVIYGQRLAEDSFYIEHNGCIKLGLDIFGSAFFMLTRYEEVVKNDRDEHIRFPVAASLAYQEGFLERPIVNEYLEILWISMRKLWPGLERKQRQYQVILSHDVDRPFAVIGSRPTAIIRNLMGDIVRRKDAKLALKRILACLSSGTKREALDPNATFNFIMDISEKYGLLSAFYFMATDGDSRFDSGYPIEGSHLRRLLKSIDARGHEIGFHAGYDTFRDPALAKIQFDRLCKVMDEENITRKAIGGRQHYLRWEAPLTWQIWDDLGLAYDSTVGFPYDPGFRAGTCYEYPIFNLLNRTKLNLTERPLIFMDGSMLTEGCANIDIERIIECVIKLADACRRHNGDLCMLWHNSSLRSARQKRLYDRVVAAVI